MPLSLSDSFKQTFAIVQRITMSPIKLSSHNQLNYTVKNLETNITSFNGTGTLRRETYYLFNQLINSYFNT